MTDGKNKKNEFVRATFYVTPEIKEAIRLLAFYERKDISEIVRENLMKSFSNEIITEAQKNLMWEEAKK